MIKTFTSRHNMIADAVNPATTQANTDIQKMTKNGWIVQSVGAQTLSTPGYFFHIITVTYVK